MLITLTTDFGEGSPYVAEMKAAALSINPTVTLIDVTHAIGAQDLRHGALVLADVAPHFPPETIHIGVVDPGVGTARKIIYAKIGDQRFLAPDNGLLSRVAHNQGVSHVRTVESPEFWRHPVSATFHGRDIMAPVAAHLTLGIKPQQLGPEASGLTLLEWPAVEVATHSLVGSVLMVDHFGNLITNITRAMLPEHVVRSAMQVTCNQHTCQGVVETYGQVEVGTAMALFGSNNRLEIAIANGNAAQTLACGIDDPVQVTWPQ